MSGYQRFCHELLDSSEFGITEHTRYVCPQCGGDTRLPIQRGSLISLERLQRKDVRRAS